jgi:hypothetical protein
MMKKLLLMARRYLMLFLLVGSAVRVDAQITSANSDRHFVTGARSASLADTYVSEPFDVVAMYTNPATLANLLNRTAVVSVSLERVLSTDNIMNENVSVPISLQKDLNLGFGLTYSHVGHIRPESPLSGMSYKQFGLDAGFAWSIFRALSLGVGVRANLGATDDGTRYSVSSSMGLYYFPTQEFGYGISLQGLGNELDYTYDSLLSQSISERRNRDKSLQVGVTWHYRGNSNRPLVTIAMANQKIFGANGMIYKGGIEGMPVSFLALRLGYWVGESTVAPKFGLGLKLQPFSIDYSVSPNSLEPVSHQLSISYDLTD